MEFQLLSKKFDLNEFTGKWQQLQQTPQVFAYNLNVSDKRRLNGTHQYYAEFNAERTTLRRPPQIIPHMDSPFDEHKFNFNKVQPLERIATIPYGEDHMDVTLIINKSPLTKYHTLLCPDVSGNHNQRITLESLMFCVAFMRDLNEPDFRLGYNSPGALASVNHLHYHLMYITEDLYIDQVELQPLCGTNIYRLAEHMPTEAVCFVIATTDTAPMIHATITKLYHLIGWLCERNTPHNLFVTFDRSAEHAQSIRIFLFARQKYCINKELNTYNIGFCELSGYFPIGDRQLYETLSEADVTAKIRAEVGQIYAEVYTFLLSTWEEGLK